MADNDRVPLWVITAMLAVVLVALAGAGWWLLQGGLRHQAPGPVEKVTIAHSTLPYAALAQIAQVQGYYRQEGLDATPLLFSHGKPALEAVLAGKADFATVAETPAMFAIMNGAPVAILATIQVSKRSHAIVARKDRGILVPEDLQGRRIGVTVGTSGDFFLDAFLLARGIFRKDIDVINLPPEKMAAAFVKGDVDAVATWAPFLMQTQTQAGEAGISFYDDDIYMLMFNVVATREYAARNPEKVRKVLQALLKAEEFAVRSPLKAQELVAGFSGMDPGTLKEMWRLNTFSLTLDQPLLLALEDESRWAINSGLTSKKNFPDYLDFLYLDGLQSVKPKAVRIFR